MNLLNAINYWWIGGIAIVVILAIVVVCMFISYYNKFVKSRNAVEESFSTMDVYLKKRYDLIPNLVETVKGYAKHEKETLSAVIEARNMAANSTTAEDKIKNEGILNETLKSLFAVAENYPTLQANQNFISLMNELRGVEVDIAEARKSYNARVKSFNTSVEAFPGLLFAKLYHFKKFAFYVVEDEKERKNIKVEF
ncbi:MAG: LemA family protein [Clostridiales bacterium]|nr:LemA family protein [Clostridiales bacterium]